MYNTLIFLWDTYYKPINPYSFEGLKNFNSSVDKKNSNFKKLPFGSHVKLLERTFYDTSSQVSSLHLLSSGTKIRL